MIYRLKEQRDKERFIKRVNELVETDKTIDLSEKRAKRSIDQNSYLHVIIGLLGIETGHTLEEAKQLIKFKCPFMNYKKKDAYFLRSTTELNTKEMTELIDWLRNWSSKELGLYLPTPDQYRQERYYYEQQIEQNKTYL